jgi:hypothetical protein
LRADTIAELTGHPAWATLRSLTAPWPIDERILFHEVMRGLVELRDVSVATAAALLVASPPRRLERLSIGEFVLTDGEWFHSRNPHRPAQPPELIPALDGDGLPELRHLGLRLGWARQAPHPLAWLWASRLGQRLRSLTIEVDSARQDVMQLLSLVELPRNLELVKIFHPEWKREPVYARRDASGAFAWTVIP